MKKKQKLPPGWDEERIRKVIAHYENQTEDEAVSEDEAAYATDGQTMIAVPTDLVPRVLNLIEREQRRRGA